MLHLAILTRCLRHNFHFPFPGHSAYFPIYIKSMIASKLDGLRHHHSVGNLVVVRHYLRHLASLSCCSTVSLVVFWYGTVEKVVVVVFVVVVAVLSRLDSASLFCLR